MADVLDATALRAWAHAAVAGLAANAEEINRLNVFPVADADTGTNMLFTMRSAATSADAPHVGADLTAVAAALSEGALHGARGNSGVILSQILRGLAEVTDEAADERGGVLAGIDAVSFAAALRHAVGLIATSVGDVVPGTIVSVLQAAASAAETEAARGAALTATLTAASDAADTALDRTRDQLDVLTEAGVVDAGGRGLLVLLDALTLTLTGHAPHRRRYEAATLESPSRAASPPQFEVMYVLGGCDPSDVDTLRTRLETLGDSVVIAAGAAGSERGGGSYSVHVHADDAGAAVEAALGFGALSRIQITAITGGAHHHATVPRGGRAVVAIVDGDGAGDLFGGEGAAVIRVDPDAAVSAQHLRDAVEGTGAGQVMVLPNGYVAAEELVAGCTAAMARGVDVVPVPTASMVQGLAALAVHDPGRAAVDDGYTMARAAAGARHGSVRIATGDALTWAGPCTSGDGLGIVGDEVLIVGADATAAGTGLVDLLLVSGGELITVLTGSGADPAVAEALRDHVHRAHPGVELAVYDTGHRGDVLLIGVE